MRLFSDYQSRFLLVFGGGNDGPDGEVSWDRPIHVPLNNGELNGWGLIGPGKAGLEIGYNPAEKFAFELDVNKSLARWPYKDNCLTVFVDTRFYKYYGPDDDGFESMLKKSKETLGSPTVMDRDPWPVWSKEAMNEMHKKSSQ